ncbi:MAG TPA: ferrous iron transporter B [Planctomycetota bacterium]
MNPAPRMALVGSPNSGKTTLFNALTGLRAKTGNYPGVTVERKLGSVSTPSGPVDLLDLPGTYSLLPISEDEAVAVTVLRGELEGEDRPDAALVVADATSLERSLPLLAEVIGTGVPACLVLTMVDELKARGGSVDLFRLQRELGVPVVGVVGHRGVGIDDLRALMADVKKWRQPAEPPPFDTEGRFAWADRALAASARRQPAESERTRRLDRVLLHPLAGPAIFLAFITIFFQAIFTWAAPAMEAMESAFDALADGLLASAGDSLPMHLLADGVVRGVGGVLVFLPQIVLLFTVIFFLEACGYMARAAFVIDRLMGWVGLEGRCFIALLSSYACAVPGILATRSIPSPRDRLATILVAPLTTCSARLPVYALLITAFVPARPVLGPFTLQGLTLMGLYFLGATSALLFAALFKRGLLRGASMPFYLELPPYRFPSFMAVGVQVWRRVKLFLRRAGTVILAASVILWFLLNFPRTAAPAGASANEARQSVIENSLAADLGHAMEPVFAPLGFDWRIDIGLIGSFAAREVMVATLAQVYAYSGEDDDTAGLGIILRRTDPATGKPPLDLPGALALLVFFVYALQCVSTLAVMRRETGGWKWPVFAFGYMFVAAWSLAFAVHEVAARWLQ